MYSCKVCNKVLEEDLELGSRLVTTKDGIQLRLSVAELKDEVEYPLLTQHTNLLCKSCYEEKVQNILRNLHNVFRATKTPVPWVKTLSEPIRMFVKPDKKTEKFDYEEVNNIVEQLRKIVKDGYGSQSHFATVHHLGITRVHRAFAIRTSKTTKNDGWNIKNLIIVANLLGYVVSTNETHVTIKKQRGKAPISGRLESQG